MGREVRVSGGKREWGKKRGEEMCRTSMWNACRDARKVVMSKRGKGKRRRQPDKEGGEQEVKGVPDQNHLTP